MSDESHVTLWADEQLEIGARMTEDGRLVFAGQDRRDLSTFGILASAYEYELTVSADDVPRVAEALGGRPHPGEVLSLLRDHGELVVRVGELTWLRRYGIEPSLRSRSS